jgi:hypothetical protein
MDVEVERASDVWDSQGQCLTQGSFKFLECVLLVSVPVQWSYGVPLECHIEWPSSDAELRDP